MKARDVTAADLMLARRLANLGARPTVIRDLVGHDVLSKKLAAAIIAEMTGEKAATGRPPSSIKSMCKEPGMWVGASVLVSTFVRKIAAGIPFAVAYADAYEHFCSIMPREADGLSFDAAYQLLRAHTTRRIKLRQCGACGSAHIESPTNPEDCPLCALRQHVIATQQRPVQQRLVA